MIGWPGHCSVAVNKDEIKRAVLESSGGRKLWWATCFQIFIYSFFNTDSWSIFLLSFHQQSLPSPLFSPTNGSSPPFISVIWFSSPWLIWWSVCCFCCCWENVAEGYHWPRLNHELRWRFGFGLAFILFSTNMMTNRDFSWVCLFVILFYSLSFSFFCFFTSSYNVMARIKVFNIFPIRYFSITGAAFDCCLHRQHCVWHVCAGRYQCAHLHVSENIFCDRLCNHIITKTYSYEDQNILLCLHFVWIPMTE